MCLFTGRFASCWTCHWPVFALRGAICRPRQTRPIRIGLQIAQYGADWPTLVAAAQEAEALGADALFNWDHFFGPKDFEVPSFECWTTLAGWAAATSHIALGPLVSCIGYRNPDLVADMARTVDHIADGRMILGLGSGFKQRDYDEYGYRFGSVADRVSDLEAGVARIRRRLDRFDPPPLGPMPLLIAGSGERRTLRLVAQHASIWHTFADGDDFIRKSQILDAYCTEIERDPAEIERSVLVGGDPGTSGPRTPCSARLPLHRQRARSQPSAREWIRWRDEPNSHVATT